MVDAIVGFIDYLHNVKKTSKNTEVSYERDLKKIFCAFASDPLVTCKLDDAKKLFREMCENTKEYLTMYDLTQEI